MISFVGKNILVVDDEVYLREILIDEFSSYGANVVGAENGNVAFKLCTQQNFDVIISDLKMPGGDGLTLMRELKESTVRPKPRRFLYSGFYDIPEETKKNLDIDATFGKPIELEKMVEIIAHFIDLAALDD